MGPGQYGDKTVIHFLAKRRFNYVDGFTFILVSRLWGYHLYWQSFIAGILLLLISMVVESYDRKLSK